MKPLPLKVMACIVGGIIGFSLPLVRLLVFRDANIGHVYFPANPKTGNNIYLTLC